MAHMIPPSIDRRDLPEGEKTPSAGERMVYERLRDDPATHDWIVLHSLDLARHVTQVEGEADFVILVPGKGVLVLEVKGCAGYRIENSWWYFGGDTKGKRSPFRQAAEARRSLQKHVAAHRSDMNAIPFWSAAIFPFCRCVERPVEWLEWQAIDEIAFESKPISEIVLGVLNQARAHLAETRTAGWFRESDGFPTKDQCQLLAKLLRPKFEYHVPPKRRVQQLEDEVKHFTDEQFRALDNMRHNDQIIFIGPAGTGKTFLAIEAARRARAQGKRVLLVAFNRLIGKWLQDYAADLAPEVTTKTIGRYMLDVAGLSVPEGATSEFWEQELPLAALDKLIARDETEFDLIIADEAQDLMGENHLQILDASLKGGFKDGKWLFFGDFERQAIYGKPDEPAIQKLRALGNGPAVFELRINCRNTWGISEYARILSSLEPGYSDVLRKDHRTTPELRGYANQAERDQLLLEAIEGMEREGFKGNQIAIISPVKEGAATAVRQGHWKDRIAPLEGARPDQIGYATIFAFKGLEAPAVIVTDIPNVMDEASRALFYVALTRAKHRLVLLVENAALAQIRTIVVQSLIPQEAGRG